VIVGSTSERPAKLTVGFGNRMFVNAGVPNPHQTICGEFPVLVSVSAEPLTAVIMMLVSITDCDAVPCERPQLLDQAVVELLVPFAGQKSLRLSAARHELDAVTPAGIDGVGKCDLGGIAAVPAIFCKPDLFNGALFGERRTEEAGGVTWKQLQ
jgi:hypothetical protein